MHYRGFLFDLDGVLTDTQRFHDLAWQRLAQELGLRFTQQDGEALKGVSRQRAFEILLEHNHRENDFSAAQRAALTDRKNGYYREYLAQLRPSDVLPGVVPFLHAAQARGILLAVASSSRNASAVLEKLQLTELFDYVADAAKIRRPKPDPEIFLNCAHALALSPAECLGFEDAQAGVEAIHAAGMRAVGIHVAVTTQAPDYPLSSTSELETLWGLDL